MAIFRMYTGSDGQSHLEEQSIAAHPILGEARSDRRISSFASFLPERSWIGIQPRDDNM